MTRPAGRLRWGTMLMLSVLVLAVGLVVAYRENAQATRTTATRVSGPPAPATPTSTSASPAAGGAPRWSQAVSGPTATTVNPGRPRRLQISGSGIDMPVTPVGVNGVGEMAMPDHPDTIGWYKYGPEPGASAGSAVLAGHVDSRRYGVGPLAELRSVRAGDRIVITTTTGRVSFRVATVQVIAKPHVALAAVFARAGTPVLRILTCGGPYLPAEGGYQDNVVVTAVPQ